MNRLFPSVKVSSRITVLIFLLLFVAGDRMHSQISSENVERHFITNARAAALADAIVSDAKDVSSMYWNPASLLFLRERSVAINYSLERICGRDNIMNENIVVCLLQDLEYAVGLGATYSHVGHVAARSPLGGLKFGQGSLDVTLARSITRPLSIGVASTIRHGGAGSNNVTVFSSGIGLMYQPLQNVSYGLSFQGIGRGIDYVLDSLTTRTVPNIVKLSHSLQLGASTRFGEVEDRSRLTLNVSGQKIFGAEGYVYKGGLEVWPINFLVLRIGYWVGTKTVASRYGGGLRFGEWQVDYGISTTELEPQFHQVSLAYCYNTHNMHR